MSKLYAGRRESRRRGKTDPTRQTVEIGRGHAKHTIECVLKPKTTTTTPGTGAAKDKVETKLGKKLKLARTKKLSQTEIFAFEK